VGETGDPSSPDRIAAAIAPVIDRLRLAVVAAMRELAAQTAERTGIAIAALPMMGMLRNTMPRRVVDVDDVLGVYLYTPDQQVRSSLDQLVAAGALARVDGQGIDGQGIVLTDFGQVIVSEMFASMQVFVDGLWEGQDDIVAATFPLADRTCEAVTATGGRAVRVVAPPYDPPGASLALRLIERLTPLRYHRFEAHAQAWREEGLSAVEVEQLGAGEQRDRIERRTNELAAGPYTVLEEVQRLELLAGLERLPAARA
jgi:hypothetical protein